MKGNKGFTLIELMIVVVIIAVLLLLGLPSYQGFVAKTRQSEARLLLGSIFTCQTIYVNQFGQYTNSLAHMGCRGEGAQTYNVGFNRPQAAVIAPTDPVPVGNATQDSVEECAAPGANCTAPPGAPVLGLANFNDAVDGNPVGVNLGAGTFKAAAEGNIDADPLTDRWYINQNKRFANTQSDI